MWLVKDTTPCTRVVLVLADLKRLTGAIGVLAIVLSGCRRQASIQFRPAVEVKTSRGATFWTIAQLHAFVKSSLCTAVDCMDFKLVNCRVNYRQ